MAATFDVVILSADRQLYSGQSISVVAPGISGSFGVLRGHVPMVTALQTGELVITDEDENIKRFAISGGFIEITAEKTLVLADSAELAENIDIERARRAHERALERLNTGEHEINIERARLSMLRALNRMKIVEKNM
ncbi:MAG: ATP synthase F1 subunit epsilon [bacterium]